MNERFKDKVDTTLSLEDGLMAEKSDARIFATLQ